MAQHVYVKNVGSKEYRDTYRDNDIVIPAGGQIEMQRRDAIAFIGKMSPAGADGIPVPKMLEIVPINGQTRPEVDEFVCNLCTGKFPSQRDLNEHLKLHAGKTVTREQIDNAKKKE
jgi:hypothetical protein